MTIDIVNWLNWAILWYLIILSFGYIFLLAMSLPDIILKFRETAVGDIVVLLKSRTMPPVTAIMVAYNEEKHDLINAVESVLGNSYTNTNIIIVNNGSTDDTLGKLIDTYNLYKVSYAIENKIKTQGVLKGYYLSHSHKNIIVLDKTVSDKSDGLNMALNACKTPIFMTVDADTILEPDAVTRIIYAMLTKPHTVSVGGAVYILNGCKVDNGKIVKYGISLKPLYALQACEYLRSFLFNRSGWNILGGSLSYAGAYTLFETQAVIDNQGFDLNNFANDFEVIVHLQATKYEKKYPYVVSYTPASISWTDVPGTLKEYWNQRVNWQVGSLKSLMKFKRMCFNPKYRMAGIYTYPFYLFGETLGPVVEFIAYASVIFSWSLGILDLYWALLFFTICWGFSTFVTIATTLISLLTFNRYQHLNDILYILGYSVVEQFGFRQFHAICRVYGTCKYILTLGRK